MLVCVAAAGAVLVSGCGPTRSHPVAQPAPGVTTFQPGNFDDLPLVPRSDPLGPRHDTGGTAVRSYKAVGTTPENVLHFYQGALGSGWHLVGGINQVGVGTYQADWENGQYHLRVSATNAPTLNQQDPAASDAIVQYSLTLSSS